MPRDPGPNGRRIGRRDHTGRVRGREPISMPVDGDGGVKSQNGPGCNANAMGWNDAEHQRAGREARAIDDDPFSGFADKLE